MINWTKLIEALEQRGYADRRYAAKEAADYLDSLIDRTTAGLGGSYGFGLLT